MGSLWDNFSRLIRGLYTFGAIGLTVTNPVAGLTALGLLAAGHLGYAGYKAYKRESGGFWQNLAEGAVLMLPYGPVGYAAGNTGYSTLSALQDR